MKIFINKSISDSKRLSIKNILGSNFLKNTNILPFCLKNKNSFFIQQDIWLQLYWVIPQWKIQVEVFLKVQIQRDKEITEQIKGQPQQVFVTGLDSSNEKRLHINQNKNNEILSDTGHPHKMNKSQFNQKNPPIFYIPQYHNIKTMTNRFTTIP